MRKLDFSQLLVALDRFDTRGNPVDRAQQSATILLARAVVGLAQVIAATAPVQDSTCGKPCYIDSDGAPCSVGRCSLHAGHEGYCTCSR